PVANEAISKQLGTRIKLFEHNYEAATGADGLALLTEWHQFRRPNFARLKELMREPVLFDGRNTWEPNEVRELGFKYDGIGRGWADAPKHLWYIARYQFFDGKPYTRLVLTLTDRHDQSPAPEPSDHYWDARRWSDWRLELGAPGGKPAAITQSNSYSYSNGGP